MPISGVNANPYAPIVESTQGLATLGDLVDYKAKLDAAKALTAERNSQTAERNQQVADRQRAVGEAARAQALVQSLVPKHMRQDGTLDQTGLLNEVAGSGDTKTYQLLADSFGKANKSILDDKKAQREEQASQAEQAAKLLRGIDKDPALAAMNIAKIRTFKPEIADYVGDGSDPVKNQNVINQADSNAEWHQTLTDLQKKDDTVKGQVISQVLAAKTPQQVQDAFQLAHTLGIDHWFEQNGFRPDTWNPETDKARLAAYIPGITADERVKLGIPATAATGEASLQLKDAMVGGKRGFVNYNPKTGEITPTNTAASPIAPQGPDQGAANDRRSDASYNASKARIDALRKPLDDMAGRMSKLTDTLDQNNPQADSLVAPELMVAMAGGMGSGVRVTQSEIDATIGGRSGWESLKAAIGRWQSDAMNTFSSPAGEMRQLIGTVSAKANAKIAAVQKADADLLDAKDVNEQRKIVIGAQKQLEDITSGPSGGPAPSGDRVRVKGPNGQTGTMPKSSALPAGWTVVK